MTAPRMLLAPGVLLLVLPPLLSPGAAAGQAADQHESPALRERLVLDAGVGARSAGLRWNIGFPGPENIMSELTYSYIVVGEATVGGTLRLLSHNDLDLLITAEGRTGEIARGTGRDSDYLGSDRGHENIRVLSDLSGRVARTEAAIGGRHQLRGHWALDHATLWLGVRRTRQGIRMRNGEWVIPYGRTMEGLDSRYRVEWEGPWIGVETRRTRGHLQITGRLLGHLAVRYRGEGEWNLRQDLAQPLSFLQTGKANGAEASLSATYVLAPGATVALRTEGLWLRLEKGRDVIYGEPRPGLPGHPQPPPTTVTMSLHEVVRKSVGAQLILSLVF